MVSLRRWGKPSLCCPLAVAFCCLLNTNPGIWARRDATNHLAYSLCFTVEGINPKPEMWTNFFQHHTAGWRQCRWSCRWPPEPQSRACPLTTPPAPSPPLPVCWWWYVLKLGLLVWEERSEVVDKRGAGWVPLVCFPEEYEDAWMFQMYFTRGMSPQISMKHS